MIQYLRIDILDIDKILDEDFWGRIDADRGC